jgi:hypothetical protein
MTNPIPTKQSISESPNSCSNSLLYHFLQLSFTLIPPDIRLKTFLPKPASRLAISPFSTQHFALYVATGLINVLQIFIFSALSTYWLFSTGRSA